MLRIVFMGSPEFAVPALQAALEHHEVVLVVTQPDKRAGRGKRMLAPPVKQAAEAAGIDVLQPRSARTPGFLARLRDTGADIGVVVAYGKILPVPVLEAFPMGCLNIHASLLPKYRGAAPIQWAVINGDTETGVAIMQLDEGMDTGPVLLERRVPISATDTAGAVFERLAPIGADALLEALASVEAGTAAPRAQDDAAASYAAMLSKQDGVIDWSQSASAVCNRVRGVDPWPGATTTLAGERLKLFGATLGEGAGQPGEVLGVDASGLRVACGDGVCAVAEMQAAGRKRMTARAYTAGRAIPAGTILGG